MGWMLAALVLAGLIGCTQQLAGMVMSEQTEPTTVEKDALALLSVSGQRFALNELNEALDQALTEAPAEHRHRVVFLLHGVGPYPNKAFDHQELEAVAEVYQGAVLLLHWPAWDAGAWRVLPRQTALAAGRTLSDWWPSLHEAPGLRDKETVLIAHSMAAEVLRGTSEKPQARVFDRLLIAAPETDAQTHAAWLSQLGLSDQTWLMINADDNMLPFSQAVMKRERLGLRLPDQRVAGVEYWYLRGVSDWHSLYASRQPPWLTQWLQARLSDRPQAMACALLKAETAAFELWLNEQLLCPR